MSDCSFLQRTLYVHPSGMVTVLFDSYTAGATQNCCHHGAFYTIQPCTILHHFMQGYTHRVHVCLAVTSHLHFWQNDQDFTHTHTSSVTNQDHSHRFRQPYGGWEHQRWTLSITNSCDISRKSKIRQGCLSTLQLVSLLQEINADISARYFII